MDSSSLADKISEIGLSLKGTCANKTTGICLRYHLNNYKQLFSPLSVWIFLIVQFLAKQVCFNLVNNVEYPYNNNWADTPWMWINCYFSVKIIHWLTFLIQWASSLQLPLLSNSREGAWEKNQWLQGIMPKIMAHHPVTHLHSINSTTFTLVSHFHSSWGRPTLQTCPQTSQTEFLALPPPITATKLRRSCASQRPLSEDYVLTGICLNATRAHTRETLEPTA